MIKIEGLTYTYSGSPKPALMDINLEIKDGEFVLIGGESGSGKSTLLYCLNGLIPHIFGGNLSGEIDICGFNPKDIPISQISKRIGTVFQNPDNQIFMSTVKEDIVFGCRNLSLEESEIEERLNSSLEELDLISLKDRPTDELSCGEKKRLAVASVYAAGPNIFLFDEPTTDLDINGRFEFKEILKKLKKKNSTVILAEQDCEYLADLIDKKIYLKDGLISKNYMVSDSDGIRRSSYPKSSSIIELEDVYFSYDGRTDILREVNLKIRKGEFTAIVGRNGSGKTTLFKLIMGILRPKRGRIFINGKTKNLDELIGKFGLLFQNPDEQLFTKSVKEEISFGPRQLGLEFDIEEKLRYFGLERYINTPPQCLSYGERKRIALISILVLDLEVILLDEPTTGLDEKNWVKLMEVCQESNLRGKTILFSTHNMRLVKMYAQRIIRLKEGRIVSDEIPE